ncbi:MAG: CTP synthase, partial [Flavobacteriaceae bacterium]|nr:CTP synthase [Flavobacteriaceae bacterium]
GLIGKYVELQDSYKSILEAFIHAGAANEVKVEVVSIHSEYIDAKNMEKELEGLHGILVAPGFGERGIEGKIEAVRYARENNLPFLGICLGMQMAVIEYSRNLLGLKEANSTEMNRNTPYPVISLMEEQKNITNMGGTMRLGAWRCDLKPNSIVQNIYKTNTIMERHRHRYEYNNEYRDALENAGLIATGTNPDTGLVEIVEIPAHPWFVGVQYHPEYKSTVANPHPLFVGFVAAAYKHSKK